MTLQDGGGGSMIDVVCDMCDEEIHNMAALLFSPPHENTCLKMHLCKDCYGYVRAFIDDSAEEKA